MDLNLGLHNKGWQFENLDLMMYRYYSKASAI